MLLRSPGTVARTSNALRAPASGVHSNGPNCTAFRAEICRHIVSLERLPAGGRGIPNVGGLASCCKDIDPRTDCRLAAPIAKHDIDMIGMARIRRLVAAQPIRIATNSHDIGARLPPRLMPVFAATTVVHVDINRRRAAFLIQATRRRGLIQALFLEGPAYNLVQHSARPPDSLILEIGGTDVGLHQRGGNWAASRVGSV